jgi:Domain of unknown function (DUF4349)
MNRDLTVEELTAELHALREGPSEEFAAALDARAASGFPRRRHAVVAGLPGAATFGRLGERWRGASPRRKLMPALAGTTTVIVVATAVVISTGGDQGEGPDTVTSFSAEQTAGAGAGQPPSLKSTAPDAAAAPGAAGAGGSAGSALRSTSGEQSLTIAPAPPRTGGAPGVRNRQVERSAQITLGTEPESVQNVAGKAIGVVGRYRGVVLSSSIRDGAEGAAGASFELLIPSGRLSAALADLSRIAEVRSRNENTLDITAPFVSAREHLQDARAEAEGLLAELAAADTEAERESVKAQLRAVRDRIAFHRSQVQRLERRANFSRVSLQIVTGEGAVAFPGAGDDQWTMGDALHDAGRVLSVAAGVTLIAAALLVPLALLGGGAWAARRIYLRRAREQTLSA